MFKTSIKIFVFIFSAVIFFTACEKDNMSNVTENQDNDNTEQRILEFKTKVDNKSKSSEEITIEDAVWLTEALANYQYCKITEEKQQADLNAISIDSIFIDISVNNNSTTISEAVNAYNEIEQTITSAFNKFEYEIKFYDLVDVEFIDNKFRVYYTFTYNTTQEKGTSTITSDWYWGMDLGKCDGTSVGRDATDVLYRQINYNVAYPANQYFTDVHHFGWKRADAVDNYGEYLFETNNNPYGDFLMYIEELTTAPFPNATCIPVNAMNYYATGTHQALNIMQDMIPTGYKFKSWGLTWFWQGYGYPNMYKKEFGHSIDVWYGIGHNIPPAN